MASLLGFACGDDVDGGGGGDGNDSGAADGAADTSGTATTGGPGTGTGDTGEDGPPPLPEAWEPGVVLPSDEAPHPRGLLDVRGLVHTHSPFSHDACDEMPRDVEGNLNVVCMEDLRRALCQVRHDYVMFTDHRDSFSDSEFPEVLLFDPERGDALIERDGDPVANWAGCEGEAPGVAPTLVMAGCEAEAMPVGLLRHAAGRGGTYGETTPEAIDAMHDAGAVVLVAHTEDWDAQELIDRPLDGFEMYNLHANLLSNLAAGLGLIGLLNTDPDALPHPDLAVMPIWQEDQRYLERWGTVLTAGVKPVTTLGTDAHRNTFMEQLQDGERVDSFRRMMHWFSNHLLVEPDADGGYDDRAVVKALRQGKLYGAFEYLGYPAGFDAYVEAGGETVEIGGTVALADGPRIVATRPDVRRLDPDASSPRITVHVMRAIEGGFEEVAGTDPGDDELRYEPDAPGAYRVEVRMTPRHLEGYLSSFADLAGEPRVWIYANPFYVE